ncbi:protein mab-21-like 3 [Mytilus edulis]|uniref:protein mab-21-like 3 n=1 Tax=Mytilus edulis TaxID=6550 RepID=UPI0039F10804
MDYTLLNKFYGDHVQMNKVETARNIKEVMRIVRKILDHVHKKDRRFKRKPLRVGSYYTHLKVSKADEFDYSVVLDVPPLDWCNDDSSYIYEINEQDQLVRKSVAEANPPIGQGLISLSDNIIQKWNRDGINDDKACLTFDDDIIPIMVKKRFKALVTEAVNKLDIENVDANRLTDSPATTLTIILTKPAKGDVSVDLTPLIESRSTFVEFLGWPRPESQWPLKKKVDEIKEMGFNNIAKHKFYWTYSFASCEKKLLEGIDNNDDNPTCRKMSEKIVKKLKEEWCPKSMKQELTSYHLLNILFW